MAQLESSQAGNTAAQPIPIRKMPNILRKQHYKCILKPKVGKVNAWAKVILK